jgi:hypothetical protein
MLPNPFFVKIFVVAQKFEPLLQFSKKLPNVNNCPMGQNSPNLVTLFKSLTVFPFSLILPLKSSGRFECEEIRQLGLQLF